MTESPEIKTYTAKEAIESAPEGWYFVSPAEKGCDFVELVRDSKGDLWNGKGRHASPMTGFFNHYGKFTGPISPDEIIPAVTEYRKIKKAREENAQISGAALRGQIVAGRVLKRLRKQIEREAAAIVAEDFPDERSPVHVAIFAGAHIALMAKKAQEVGLNEH